MSRPIDEFDGTDEIVVDGSKNIGTIDDLVAKFGRAVPTEQDTDDLLRRTFPGMFP